jgi:hypothetical protein
MPINIIPPMTHPYGKHWEQPDISEILIDDTHAVMGSDTLSKIKDYSRSLPSGVYAGKMWRASDDGIVWYLKWWTDSETAPDKCTNHTREIIIL